MHAQLPLMTKLKLMTMIKQCLAANVHSTVVLKFTSEKMVLLKNVLVKVITAEACSAYLCMMMCV